MNIINAIINIVNNPVLDLASSYTSRNRANAVGDALEEYVKDLFSDSFGLGDDERLKKWSEVFSYLGNSNNPPDIMLRGGDAIEVKKIESNNSALALNSSYPKHKIRSDSPMISRACAEAENWKEKDIIYTVGVVGKNDNKLKHLCMVYGLDYCASEECYSKIRQIIKNAVEETPNIEFSESKELGHINKVDPLGITYMRVRGMWGIENPWKVFSYIYERNTERAFNFMAIINMNKWREFGNINELIDLAKINDGLVIKDVRIKNPDNPAQLVDAKLVSFSV